MAHHVPVAPHTEGRRIPGHRLGEKEMLRAWLRFARATVEAKATGLTPAQLIATPSPSEISVGGILTHLVTVEHHWFGNVLGGQAHPMPFGPGDPDGDWRVPEDADADSLLTRYRAACAASDTVIASLALDDLGAQTTDDYTLRWAMTHVTIDTSRHAGQADLLRELLDGERGW
ncbi:DinB family protein [Streptomyces sp. AJS327]|uniref:DinB family protein n=1 Tax=Streptomyces sp. AJS327 TaxID=2545265 RepID=UPI0015DD88CF|nr:DinB family protein [Streptomyces sp. AJS327]MBA0052661.1 DinB family protein [Streptomyces sp. AJS327]